MHDTDSTLVWPGLTQDNRFWIVRSDAGLDAQRAGLGCALFNPQGQWVASVSRCVDARDTSGNANIAELLALQEAMDLADAVCPGAPLLLASDSSVALSMVRSGSRGRNGAFIRIALQLRWSIGQRPQGSTSLWVPREANRLANALALRARLTHRLDTLQGASSSDLAHLFNSASDMSTLAELDQAWLASAPARLATDFRSHRLTIEPLPNCAVQHRRYNAAHVAQACWSRLSAAARDELARFFVRGTRSAHAILDQLRANERAALAGLPSTDARVFMDQLNRLGDVAHWAFSRSLDDPRLQALIEWHAQASPASREPTFEASHTGNAHNTGLLQRLGQSVEREAKHQRGGSSTVLGSQALPA